MVVLLVDDNRELREVFAEFLSLKGHTVRCAANGSEALLSLAHSQTVPALIFLNLVSVSSVTLRARGRCRVFTHGYWP